jgi:hypothetical protein
MDYHRRPATVTGFMEQAKVQNLVRTCPRRATNNKEMTKWTTFVSHFFA